MTNKKKIALVTAFPPSGGTLNEYGFHMAREFSARDDVSEVLVIADTLENPVAEPFHGEKIRVVRAWKFNDWRNPFKVLSLLLKERPDGVVYNVQTASFGDREIPAALGLMMPMMSRFAGMRSGVLAHNLIEGIDLNNTILKGNFLRQKLVQFGGFVVSFTMTRANYLTTTLDSYAGILKKRFPHADISMVPHGTFARPHLDLLPFEKRKKRIVTMGKFGTYKRLETLIAAFEELHKSDGELQLGIGGTDHPNSQGYMAKLETMHKDNPAIRFEGYIAEEDVPGFFAGARLAVFDYTATTGSSGVLHQCASYGAVPIFPRIGDFVEMCEREGLSGFNYQPGDQGSMREAMRAALTDDAVSQMIANNNLKAVDEIPLSKVIDFHMKKLCSDRHAAGSQEKENGTVLGGRIKA